MQGRRTVEPPAAQAQPLVPVSLDCVGNFRRITALVSPGAAAWGMWAARIKQHLSPAVGRGSEREAEATALIITTAGQLPLAALAHFLGRDVLARLAVVRVADTDGVSTMAAIAHALQKAKGRFGVVVIDSPCFDPPVERELTHMARRDAEDVRKAMRVAADAGAHVYFTAPRVRGQWPPRHRDFGTAPRVQGLTGDVFRMGGGMLWQPAAEAIIYAEEEEDANASAGAIEP